MIFLLLVSTTVHSDDWRGKCANFSGFAEDIMTARQAGVSMAEVIGIVDGNEVVEELVIKAYEKPGYDTESMKQKSVRDYGNFAYLMCAKQLKKLKGSEPFNLQYSKLVHL